MDQHTVSALNAAAIAHMQHRPLIEVKFSSINTFGTAPNAVGLLLVGTLLVGCGKPTWVDYNSATGCSDKSAKLVNAAPVLLEGMSYVCKANNVSGKAVQVRCKGQVVQVASQ